LILQIKRVYAAYCFASRDPRTAGQRREEEEEEVPVDSKEREKQEIAKAEAEARKAANQRKCPNRNNASAIAAKKFSAGRNEKTTQVYRMDKTEEEKKKSDLRYEELCRGIWRMQTTRIPGRNYEAALSDTNVASLLKDLDSR